MTIKQDLRVLFFCAVQGARIIIAHSTTPWFETRGVATPFAIGGLEDLILRSIA